MAGHAHELIRAVLDDRRFTAVTSDPDFPMMTRTSTLLRSQPQSASFIRMDDPDHARLRRKFGHEVSSYGLAVLPVTW